jgi:oxygen-independent coproporphyrinogen-3 oxidase
MDQMETQVGPMSGETIPREAPRGLVGGSLTRMPREDTRFPPVVLTHGTFSNAKLCERLARYLQEAGFDCWVLEWPAHGQNPRGGPQWSYEQLALHEVRGTLETVHQTTGEEGLFWVGHSAGGVLPFIHLARNPAEAHRFRGIITLGSQTTHAGPKLLGRMKLGLGFVVTNVLGRAPGAVFRLGPDDEPRALMNQWFRWNLSGRWRGEDGFDYLEALGRVRVPTLCMAGAGDDFIAPMAGCRRLFDALGSEDKTFVTCAKAEGFREDYNHTRLIASRSAQEELWPRIAEWLTKRGERAS